MTSGASAFIPKGSVTTVVVGSVIDAGESVAKQYNETGKVSIKPTAVDVATNKVAGKLTANVSLNSSSAIKTTEKQLNRAERVAAGDPKSSGRAATVNKMENKLATQNGFNQAAKQAASGIVSGTIQGVANGSQASNGIPPSINYSASDNTAVKRPMIPLISITYEINFLEWSGFC